MPESVIEVRKKVAEVTVNFRRLELVDADAARDVGETISVPPHSNLPFIIVFPAEGCGAAFRLMRLWSARRNSRAMPNGRAPGRTNGAGPRRQLA